MGWNISLKYRKINTDVKNVVGQSVYIQIFVIAVKHLKI